jgi:hypothetical protein
MKCERGASPRTLLLSVALLSVCVASAVAADKSGTYTIFSMGTKSCGEVVSQFKEDGQEKWNNSVWIAGYLTAINQYVVKQKKIAAGTEPEGWNLWVNNYCAENPLDSLADAANALVKKLSKKAQ